MNIKLLISLALITLACASQMRQEKENFIFAQFKQFVSDYNKNYATIDEFISRFNNFKQNYLNVESFNLENTEATHRIGINIFSDMTIQEFRKTYLNLDFTSINMKETDDVIPTFTDLPKSLDWRQKGAVSPVKSQGSCGSCWAFSTVGNLEGIYKIKTGNLVTFSEQQLVDCDKVDKGCKGGWMQNGFDYIKNAGGLELSRDYAYIGREGNCRFDARKAAAVRVYGYIIKSHISPEEIKAFLQSGPLAIALNANSFYNYHDGILNQNASQCNPYTLNHGVTLIGYGVEGAVEYLIIKNSWGNRWGENGFIRIANNGTCGVNLYVSSAKLQ
jgi:C1A family cysteine protease